MITSDTAHLATAAPVLSDERAVGVARAAAAQEADGEAFVGDVVDARDDGTDVVTVRFAANVDGYRGWHWSVTVARVDPDRPTISEVALLPGPDALVAPEWVPWKQRISPDDLGVGDVLITSDDDPRVVPAYLQSDDPAVEDVAHELGIGRERVMSHHGRAKAAKRWRRGEFGPNDEMATHAPAHCGTCAFYLPLAGSLSAGFGACGNKYSPADGHVVHVGYGCGAHSQARLRRQAASSAAPAVLDDLALEVHPHPVAPDPTDAGDAADAAGGTDAGSTADAVAAGSTADATDTADTAAPETPPSPEATD